MVAIDTNVLVRVLVADHPEQCRAARELWESNRIWIAKSVLLETEWVLRSVIRTEHRDIRRAFDLILADQRVSVEDRAAVQHAVAWFGAGMDSAHALHLASIVAADRFVTFDKGFIATARGVGMRVEEPT